MIRTLMFETPNDRGFVFRAWNLNDGKGNALIEVEKASVLIRSFQFPAYKVWNISAHAKDIVDSELRNNIDGYLIAGSDGLGGNVFKTEG